MNLFVSILVPVYNTEQYLSTCLNSLVNQTYDNYEIIIIDDGSTDNSGVICDDWARRYNRITVIHKENQGLMSARLDALAVAKGDYLCHVDSDDLISPEYLQCLVDNATLFRSDMVLSPSGDFDGTMIKIREYKHYKDCYSKESIQTNIIPSLLHSGSFFSRGFPINNWGKLIRTELVRQNEHYYDTTITYGEDLNMIFPVLLDCNVITICRDERALYYYRNNPNSIVNNYKENMFQQIKTLHMRLWDCSVEKNVYSIYDQILADFVDCALYCVSNELKSRQSPQIRVGKILRIIRDEWFIDAIAKVDYSHYEWKYKIVLNCIKAFTKLTRGFRC